jgi:hypothetical protein
LFPSGVNLTADSTTFNVDATGDKVGIGTTSPSQKLHVIGNATIVDSVSIYGGNYNYANIASFPVSLSVGNGTRNFSIYANSSLIGIFSDVKDSFPGSNPAPTAVGGRIMNSTGGQVVSGSLARYDNTRGWTGVWARYENYTTESEAFLATKSYAGYFKGNVSVTNSTSNAGLCLNGDCRTTWPSFGSMSSWNIAGDSGSDAVTDGQTATVAGGTDGIDTSESGRTVTVTFDATELPADDIAESAIKFSTVCSGDNKLLTSGTDLTCSSETDPQVNTVTANYACYGTGSAVTCANSNFYWDNTNSLLGIGISAPTTTLSVRGNAANSSMINVTNVQDTPIAIALSSTAQQWQIGQNKVFGTGAFDDFYINDLTAGATRLYITTAGLTGIGTTSPKNQLDVEGAAAIGATYSGTNTAPANGLLVEGNVGIGTSSPAAKLHVQAGTIIGNSSGSGAIPSNTGVFGSGSSYGVVGNASGVVYSSVSGVGVFGAGSQAGVYGSSATYPGMFLGDGGAYVFIGDSGLCIENDLSPSCPAGDGYLIVYNGSACIGDEGCTLPTGEGHLRVNNNVTIGSTEGSSNLDLYGGAWDLANTNGDLKIGSSTYRLKIGTAISGAGAGIMRIRSHGGKAQIIIGSNTTDTLAIGSGTNTNYVGIGTITPDVALDVNGDIEGNLVTLSAGTGPVCYTTGGASGGVYKLTRNTAACTTSSIRFKDNVTDFYAGLPELMKLRPVKYRYKPTNLMDIGFIAEEVENVSTDLVSYGMDGLVESVKYDKLTTVIVNAMKEQQAEISRLKEQDTKREQELLQLREEIADLKLSVSGTK